MYTTSRRVYGRVSLISYTTTLVLMLLGGCVNTGAVPKSTAPNNDKSVSNAIVVGTQHSIESTVLGTTRNLSVRLPAEYHANPGSNFPVVYLVDGGAEQDFVHIAGIAHSREMNGTFAPFILVGIETVNRRYQITPPVRDSDEYQKTLGAKPGGSNEFRRFLREDVIPWVNGQYRTSGQDAVIGESLAGLFIVETLLKDPTLFDDYIAVTPSLWWDDMHLARGATQDLLAMPAGNRRLYLTMADEGFLMQEGLDRLISALENHGSADLKWTYVERKDSESHASIYHVAALDAFRAFYLTAGSTGGTNPATFPDGAVPPLTEEAKISLIEPCVRDRAIQISFKEKNKDMNNWAGRCLLMKPGAEATKGNLTY